MRNKILILLSVIICAAIIVYASAPTEKKSNKAKTETSTLAPHAKLPQECKRCHYSDFPTKKEPSLNACPRKEMITVEHTAAEGPETVVMNYGGRQYGKVAFSHKIHAQMSEFSGSCDNCHHYNIVGTIQKCSECHEENRKRTDISRPDLKAAMHRLCYNCHKNWNHSNDCNYCHTPIKKDNEALFAQKLNSLKGKTHPEYKVSPQVVYETKAKEGKYVAFYHDDHVKQFNLECKNCHKKDNCTKCHDDNAVRNEPKHNLNKGKSMEAIHANCISCHKNNSCTKCHQNEVKQAFNHKAVTGFDLSKFHGRLDCSRCHKKMNPADKPNRTCQNCHSNFVAGKFNHERTGLKLNELHKDFECSSCHKSGYEKAATCTECHDDKTYPKFKPGSPVKR